MDALYIPPPVTAYAPGKVLLTGEYSVLEGKIGVGSAINRHATVRVQHYDEGNVRISSDVVALDGTKTKQNTCAELSKLVRMVRDCKARDDFKTLKEIVKDPYAAHAYVVGSVLEDHDYSGGVEGMDITITSTVDKNLGSSSAVFSALAHAIITYCRQSEPPIYPLSMSDTERYAYEGDILAHGALPSGIDSATVTRGGYILFRTNHNPPVTSFELKLDGLELLVVDTKEPTKTSIMIEKIKTVKKSDAHAYYHLIDQLERISWQVVKNLHETGDRVALGEAMTAYYQRLAEVGVTTETTQRLVSRAIVSGGALGAKYPGAGGGGSVIVLAQDISHMLYLMRYFKKELGLNSYPVKLGESGVRIKAP